MTKKLDRVYVRPHVKKQIKIGAAQLGCDMSEFIERKISEPDDILTPPKKKRGGSDPFEFNI